MQWTVKIGHDYDKLDMSKLKIDAVAQYILETVPKRQRQDVMNAILSSFDRISHDDNAVIFLSMTNTENVKMECHVCKINDGAKNPEVTMIRGQIRKDSEEYSILSDAIYVKTIPAVMIEGMVGRPLSCLIKSPVLKDRKITRITKYENHHHVEIDGQAKEAWQVPHGDLWKDVMGSWL